jgi:hypothetical protein
MIRAAARASQAGLRRDVPCGGALD